MNRLKTVLISLVIVFCSGVAQAEQNVLITAEETVPLCYITSLNASIGALKNLKQTLAEKALTECNNENYTTESTSVITFPGYGGCDLIKASATGHCYKID